MKISKKAREEAIEACVLTADWWFRDLTVVHPLSRTLVSDDVHDLGFDAMNAVERAIGRVLSNEGGAALALEAAALLRDGWNPGDPVEVRR